MPVAWLKLDKRNCPPHMACLENNENQRTVPMLVGSLGTQARFNLRRQSKRHGVSSSSGSGPTKSAVHSLLSRRPTLIGLFIYIFHFVQPT